jgi:hypothetical protein
MSATKLIDGKEAFGYFMKFFSIQRAYRQYVYNHPEVINEETGKAVTRQGFQASAWKYILLHIDECKSFIRDKLGERGIVLTEELWKSIRVTYARKCWSGGVLKRYLEENGLLGYEPMEIPKI